MCIVPPLSQPLLLASTPLDDEAYAAYARVFAPEPGRSQGELDETTCLLFECCRFMQTEHGVIPWRTRRVVMSRAAIDSGAAMDKLYRWVQTQNRNPDEGLKKLRSALPLERRQPSRQRSQTATTFPASTSTPPQSYI